MHTNIVNMAGKMAYLCHVPVIQLFCCEMRDRQGWSLGSSRAWKPVP